MTAEPATAAAAPGPAAKPAPPVRVLGVRHHGPGSARAVQRVLADYQPDCVLIEGPADADGLVKWVSHAEMAPPVALLAWSVEDPGRAAFWPLAVFSPEWQALRWAGQAGVPVRFMDLPSSNVLTPAAKERVPAGDDAQPAAPVAPDRGQVGAEPGGQSPGGNDPDDGSPEPGPDGEPGAEIRNDPIALLARAAGYDDPEAWWEDTIEFPGAGAEPADPFDALAEAMTELRRVKGEEDRFTLQREAHMRKVLRAARRAGHRRIAVVCGAWHAPALSGKSPGIAEDNALLRGLPKIKTELTWAPWTHGRLALRSGYGAGIDSPGWYHHLFNTHGQPTISWFTKVAGALRAADLPISTAHLIEAVRLAETLAVLRGRPLPGLDEVQEATWSVLCEGDAVSHALATREVVVGELLGAVPEGVPTVPLDADLRATARRLRLKFEATARTIRLDLRKPNDLAKSQFLARLRILGIDWGSAVHIGGKGTFKEGWELAWDPEYQVAVIEAARFGTTVAAAAGAALLAQGDSLAKVTEAVERALHADLGEVLPELLARLDEFAAHEADIGQLLRTLPPLARSQRYGDVRGTDTTRLAVIARQVLARACAGLPAAASGLAAEAAATVRADIDAVQTVIALLAEDDQRLWVSALTQLLNRHTVPGTIAGRVTRILLDGGQIDSSAAAGRLSRTLSIGTAPDEQAYWLESFLAGNPMLLVLDRKLLGIVDEWLRGINGRVFVDVLPILRRAFGQLDLAARRQVAGAVRRLGTEEAEAEEVIRLGAADEPLLATIELILGGRRDG